MSKKKAYVHLDFETTSLKPWKGHARSYGMVITDGNLQPYGQASHEEWVHTDLWEKGTLDFAAKTYGPEFLATSMEKGLTDWRHVWAHLTDAFSQDIKTFQDAFGEHELWLVCNHTDFDFTILRVMYDMLTRQCPIKYNHSLDMQSLMVGHNSGEAHREFRNALDAEQHAQRGPTLPSDNLRKCYDARGGKENVTHNALEDALAQVAMLDAQGVRLPE